MRLADAKILLTGASGGIGRALALALAEGGARLVVAGRQAGPLAELAARHPGRIVSVSADLTTREGRDAVEAAVDEAGGVNVLVNAAGVNAFAFLEAQDEEAIAALVSLNATATMQLTARLLPRLRRAPAALVVNVGSTFGSIGYPGFAAYCASKFAIRGFSQALRRELADSRVKVLYLAPRATRTAMNDGPIVAMNAALRVAMDPPAEVAGQIVEAIEREREEVYLGWPERLFVRLNGLWPRLVDRSLRRQLPVIRRFARPDPPQEPA